MKYLILVLEGATTAEPSGKTPLEAAETPELDYLARRGQIGAVRLLPEEVRLPIEASYLSILGYDPQHYYTGRGPLVAAALRVTLGVGDVAFCCPLIATDGSTVLSGTVESLPDDETLALMNVLAERLGMRRLAFYPAPQNNGLLCITDGPTALTTVPLRRIAGKRLEACLPHGEEEERLRGLIYDSLELLSDHPINRRRQEEGLLPANTIWPYGQGRPLTLPDFTKRYGVTGTVVSHSLLIQGIARAAGLGSLTLPETGNTAKVMAVRHAFKEGVDLVLLPITITGEGEILADEARQEQIERADREVIGPLLNRMQKGNESFRVLCFSTLSDGKPADLPFLLYDAEEEGANVLPFDERALSETRRVFEEGHRLLSTVIR